MKFEKKYIECWILHINIHFLHVTLARVSQPGLLACIFIHRITLLILNFQKLHKPSSAAFTLFMPAALFTMLLQSALCTRESNERKPNGLEDYSVLKRLVGRIFKCCTSACSYNFENTVNLFINIIELRSDLSARQQPSSEDKKMSEEKKKSFDKTTTTSLT